ncbi:MAG: hypothetical protein AAF416_18120 [Pseudomonadota bacterium]
MGVFDGLAEALTTGLGEAITVSPAGGTAREITAIFKMPSELTLSGDVSQRRPMVRAQTTDVSDLSEGDILIARSQTFRIQLLEPNARGLTDLTLETDDG